MAALTSADLQTMQELLHTKRCQRALRIARAAQQAIEIEVQHLLSRMEEEELVMEALEDQVTDARSRWRTAAIQVLTVKNILTSQGVAPPKTEHKSSATFVQLLAEVRGEDEDDEDAREEDDNNDGGSSSYGSASSSLRGSPDLTAFAFPRSSSPPPSPSTSYWPASPSHPTLLTPIRTVGVSL
jgi:hypothetical protein